MTEPDITEEERVLAAALTWHRAIESDAVDWDAFTLWLEETGSNCQAFDAIALIDDELAEWPASAANENVPSAVRSPVRARAWWLGGIAAAVVVAVSVPLALSTQDDPVTSYATRTDEQRVVALADGSRVVVAPGSAITIKGNTVALASGAAWFDIRHDPSRQLTVTANGWQVTDIGTRFEAKAVGRDSVWVGVAHGTVSVARSEASPTVHLNAGEGALGSGTRVERVTFAPSDLATWRDGRLVYNDTPLAVVTADLSRYAGVPVTARGVLASTRFTGSLSPAPGPAAVRQLADILGAQVVEDGTGLTLVPGGE